MTMMISYGIGASNCEKHLYVMYFSSRVKLPTSRFRDFSWWVRYLFIVTQPPIFLFPLLAFPFFFKPGGAGGRGGRGD